MKNLSVLLVTLFMVVLASCNGGGDDDPTPAPQETPTISVPSNIISNGVAFTSQAGETSVSFTTNTDWTLSMAEARNGVSWCTPSATSGTKGNVTIKFTLTENTDYEDRSVSVTIKAGTATSTFKITQKCADALLVTSNTFEIGEEGGNIEIEVKSNINYQMEISDAAKGWISESNSRALTTKKHIFAIASSNEYEKREGEIYIKSGDKTETIKVYQNGGGILILSKDDYIVSDAGETITVDIQSNFEYGLQMPEVDWIKEESASRGLSSHSLKFVISPNETYDSRSTEIVFYDKNSSLSDTVYITQAQKDAIILSQKEYEIAAKGGNIEVTYESNVNVTFKSNCDWIKLSSTSSRALTTSSIILEVSENTTSDKRTGTVTISHINGTLTETLTVTQKAKSIDSSIEDFNVENQEW